MEALSLWVIYDHPLDYPTKFVVRRFGISDIGQIAADEECKLAETLAGARNFIPSGLFRIPHQEGEDRVIVETWL